MNQPQRDVQDDGFRRELILEIAPALVGNLQWMEMMITLRSDESPINHRIFDFEQNIAFSIVEQVDEIIKASKYPNATAYRDAILEEKRRSYVEAMNQNFYRSFGGPNNDQEPPQSPDPWNSNHPRLN